MKKTVHRIFILSFWSLVLPMTGMAQEGSGQAADPEEGKKKISFNGLGRAYMLQTGLDGAVLKSDTTRAESLTDGEFLLDLALNAIPNDKTEIQGILRLRNEFGGFFGAGVSVEVRELWARGIIANALKYRVGDMDHEMTPYTLYSPDEEGMVHEAAVFHPQKEVIYYENFYQKGHSRRLQGAKLDVGLRFSKWLKDADFSGFVSRLRGTDFLTTPTRFLGGGSALFTTQTIDSLGAQAKVGVNFVNTWDDLRSGDANSGIRNRVVSLNFDVVLWDKPRWSARLTGETGFSHLEWLDDKVSNLKKEDTFIESGFSVAFKPQNLTLSAAFVDVGPDFFSVGAQSKKVDLDRAKSYYNRLGSGNPLRAPALFDLSRDRAIYTYQISDRLMPYDPRFSNTLPYGAATPNRRGGRVGVIYGRPEGLIETRLNAAFLKEIRGQGTFELKQFTLLRAAADWNIHQLSDWKKKLRLTLGYQYEKTSRGGIEVDRIDLHSHLLETGLEAELFASFELLLGAKILSAEGNEYIPLIEVLNEIKDFPGPYLADDSETLLAGGLKFTFKKGIYLTLQYQQFDLKRARIPENDYQLNQLFLLYNMNF